MTRTRLTNTHKETLVDAPAMYIRLPRSSQQISSTTTARLMTAWHPEPPVQEGLHERNVADLEARVEQLSQRWSSVDYTSIATARLRSVPVFNMAVHLSTAYGTGSASHVFCSIYEAVAHLFSSEHLVGCERGFRVMTIGRDTAAIMYAARVFAVTNITDGTATCVSSPSDRPTLVVDTSLYDVSEPSTIQPVGAWSELVRAYVSDNLVPIMSEMPRGTSLIARILPVFTRESAAAIAQFCQKFDDCYLVLPYAGVRELFEMYMICVGWDAPTRVSTGLEQSIVSFMLGSTRMCCSAMDDLIKMTSSPTLGELNERCLDAVVEWLERFPIRRYVASLGRRSLCRRLQAPEAL